MFRFGPWARLARYARATARLRAKIADLEEQLVNAKVSEARAQAQIAVLRPLLEEEKKAKQNAFDRLGNVLGIQNVYDTAPATPAGSNEPVSYGNNPKDWIAEAEKIEHQAAIELQRQKVENIMKYRRETDASTEGQEALATAEPVS